MHYSENPGHRKKKAFWHHMSIIMVVRIIDFSIGGIKLERFLPKNKYTKRILWNFENWTNGGCQKVPKFDFLSQFSTSKNI